MTDTTTTLSPELIARLRNDHQRAQEVAEVVRGLCRGWHATHMAWRAEVEALGAVPFIPMKTTTVEPAPGSAWARMWHMFEYRRDEFLTHYHKRSNVETVFAMVKAKFGDSLLGKTPEAQDNEVLAKFVAHNLCVLVQAFYELGIEADFRAA